MLLAHEMWCHFVSLIQLLITSDALRSHTRLLQHHLLILFLCRSVFVVHAYTHRLRCTQMELVGCKFKLHGTNQFFLCITLNLILFAVDVCVCVFHVFCIYARTNMTKSEKKIERHHRLQSSGSVVSHMGISQWNYLVIANMHGFMPKEREIISVSHKKKKQNYYTVAEWINGAINLRQFYMTQNE